MGNLAKSIEYLKKYLDETVPNSSNSQYGKICSSLASIFNTLVRKIKLTFIMCFNSF
jgi:hypothetical protein